jgi:hypothetical protein
MIKSAILLGQPDSGKSNFLGRVWENIRAGAGTLALIDAQDIEYLEELLSHLLNGSFAPRSNKDVEQSRRDVRLTIKEQNSSEPFELVVPDVTGELWKEAAANSDLPEEWMAALEKAQGALLFLRVGSEENHQPLDWVASKNLLELLGVSGGESSTPTQVVYSELLRFLQVKLGTRLDLPRRKVAIVITAWDRLDPEFRETPPIEYLKREFPLLAGRIENVSDLEIRLFGVSVVGGDLEDDEEFKAQYQNGDISDFGYVVIGTGTGQVSRKDDLTLPLNWLFES